MVVPWRVAVTIPDRRSTASCWERLDGSMSISASRSRTGLGPSWSSSRTRMRTGWPSIRKNSALAWYSGTGIDVLSALSILLAIYKVEDLFNRARGGADGRLACGARRGRAEEHSRPQVRAVLGRAHGSRAGRGRQRVRRRAAHRGGPRCRGDPPRGRGAVLLAQLR